MTDSVFHVRNVENMRRELCAAILRLWAIPMIEPVGDSYEASPTRSRFYVHDLNTTYEIEIKAHARASLPKGERAT